MIELDDLSKNNKKKNSKWHFGEVSDESFNSIWSLDRYCI